MQCFACNHKNTGGVTYCMKCGAKLDMTADEIQAYYAQKVRDEKRKAAEFHARRLLYFAIVALIMAITFIIVAGSAPKNSSYVPSATVETKFILMDYELGSSYKTLYIPAEENR